MSIFSLRRQSFNQPLTNMAKLEYFILASVILGLSSGLIVGHHKRQYARPCQQGAAILGEMLDLVQQDMPEDFPFTVPDAISELAGMDVTQQDVREDIVCGLEGLTTLSELQAAAYELWLHHGLLRAAYAEFVMQMISIKNYPRKDNFTAQFVSHLEEFGLMSLDPTGYNVYIKPLMIYFEEEVGPILPPSTLSLEEQCEILSAELWKMWIAMSDRTSIKFEDLAGAFHNWTGIDMTDEEAFNELVCEFMGKAQNGGLYRISIFLRYTGVYTRLLKWGYPVLVNGAKWLQEELPKPQTKRNLMIEALRSKKSNQRGRPGRSDGTSNKERWTLVARLLDNLEDMGLYTLRDDLIV